MAAAALSPAVRASNGVSKPVSPRRNTMPPNFLICQPNGLGPARRTTKTVGSPTSGCWANHRRRASVAASLPLRGLHVVGLIIGHDVFAPFES